MGIEIVIDDIEDMCALMCDNVLPKKWRTNENPTPSQEEKSPRENRSDPSRKENK